jgi:hypothetical protein
MPFLNADWIWTKYLWVKAYTPFKVTKQGVGDNNRIRETNLWHSIRGMLRP